MNAFDFEKDLKWSQTLKSMNLQTQHKNSLNSMCFEQNNKLIGINHDKPIRIASLSKLYTSYWALKTWGEDYKFETTARYINESLYIKSNDLLFNREHIFKIIRELTTQNVFKVKYVYIDSDLLWYHRNSVGRFLNRYSLNEGA